MHFIIKSSSGHILYTNLERDNLINEIIKCNSECERVYCTYSGKNRRQGRILLDNLTVYVCTYDDSVTNRIFKNKLEGVSILGKLIDLELINSRSQEGKKTRRLKHNLINHNSNILQELYKLIPQDAFRSGGNHVDLIEGLLKRDIWKAAFTYLKVLKSSILMKAEFEVYDMLNTDDPYLDFTEHQIHRVLILTLNPFWLDLAEKKILINIQAFYEKVHIDYRSISVSLSHIFDNTVKYIMPHSELNISFRIFEKFVEISLVMTSLKVEPNELDQIFNESNSGKWATDLGLNGDGVGMFMVKKLIELNHGEIQFIANYNDRGTLNYNGVPYENNKILIRLKKEADELPDKLKSVTFVTSVKNNLN
jgi:signal transduction histidine kinase